MNLKKVGKAIEAIGDVLSEGINKLANSGVAGKATSKLYDTFVRGGAKLGLKTAAKGMEGAAEGVDFFRRHKKFFKKVGSDAAHEVGEMGKAAFGIAEMADRLHIVEKAPLHKSLIGLKFSAGAKWGIAGAGLIAGSIGGTKEYLQSRQGRGDGQLYRPTPMMGNPYEIAQSMAYSRSGASYADNAGADADLARAISGMR